MQSLVSRLLFQRKHLSDCDNLQGFVVCSWPFFVCTRYPTRSTSDGWYVVLLWMASRNDGLKKGITRKSHVHQIIAAFCLILCCNLPIIVRRRVEFVTKLQISSQFNSRLITIIRLNHVLQILLAISQVSWSQFVERVYVHINTMAALLDEI